MRLRRGWLVYWISAMALVGLLVLDDDGIDIGRGAALLALFVVIALVLRITARAAHR